MLYTILLNYPIITIMEQKNEFLMLKNYTNFLIDLGLNISFSLESELSIIQAKFKKKFTSIQDLDNHIKEWQIKNNLQLILRNNNIFSKNILLLSEENCNANIDQVKKKELKLLEKMFASIGQNIDDFFIINIDLVKMKTSHSKKINKILKLYFKILDPKIIINMCSDVSKKYFEVNNFSLNLDNFKIPAVSDIIKNQNLKREAWSQLKLLKEKLNEV